MTNLFQQVTTQRLVLAPIDINDHVFVLQLLNSEGWIQFIGDRNVHTIEEAKAYIDKIQHKPNLVYWVVKRVDDNYPIGIISYMKRDYLDSYDLGFAFLPEFQQQGFAFEAANAILQFVITATGDNNVLATLLPNNLNSIKLLIKLNFQFKSTICVDSEDLHIYAYKAS